MNAMLNRAGNRFRSGDAPRVPCTLPPEPEDRHILERPVRFFLEWPRDVGVDPAGLGILMIEQHKSDLGLNLAAEQTQGTTCDHGRSRAVSVPSGGLTKSSLASSLPPGVPSYRNQYVGSPIRSKVNVAWSG